VGLAVTQPNPDPAAKREALRARLDDGGLIVAPGVFDLVSARRADAKHPAALYMTGYGVVASHLGLPDAGLAGYAEMVERVRRIASHTRAPLIADGDTGYGGLLNVQHTVRGYEQAGAAGIQLEDQEFPKKCGHTPGRRVIPLEDMVAKIKVAVECRDHKNFMIVARTDARTAHGLDEALRRGEAYARAGADLLFIESPEDEAEMARIGAAFERPLLANLVEGGRTPLLPAERLRELGYRMAIFPVTGLLAAAAALDRAYASLIETGSAHELTGALYPFADFNRLIGFGAVWEFERRHADDEAAAPRGHEQIQGR